MSLTERMLLFWFLNELVKLEQNLSIFYQLRYMTKNSVEDKTMLVSEKMLL